MTDMQKYFEDAKAIETKNDSGEAAERSMLKKEARRMMEESAAFEKSKSAWRKNLMKASLIVAGCSLFVNVVQGIAIATLTPLKTVEPYLLYVDKSSGNAEVRQPLQEALPTYGQEADKFFIREFVTARESYDWNLAQYYYDKVSAFSVLNASVFREYDAFIKSEKSPLAILADKARVVVDITSVTIDEQTYTATVRFNKTVMAADGKPHINIPRTHWIATIAYQYPNPSLKPAERRLNPLGMKIPSYQIVQEQLGGL